MSNWRDKSFTARRVETEKFQQSVFDGALENAIEWIADNLSVENVFKENDIIDYISDNSLPPEKVFDVAILAEWAEENGYVKSED